MDQPARHAQTLLNSDNVQEHATSTKVQRSVAGQSRRLAVVSKVYTRNVQTLGPVKHASRQLEEDV